MVDDEAERIAHHKIRNNLQIVSSLINLQLHVSVEPSARSALSAVQQRIHALAMIHYDLPEAGTLQEVDLGKLLPAFCRRLQSMVSTEDREIEITSMITPATAPSGRAVVLAMLIAEIVVHLVQHGLSGSDKGWILVQLLPREDGGFGFSILCEGAGTGVALESDTLKSRIVGSYVRQLKGELTHISNGQASGLQIEFPSLVGA